MYDFVEDKDWKEILDRLSAIREQEDYSSENIEYIRKQLQSPDDRVRGGAALTAEGCLFEAYILDMLLDIAENDSSDVIRKAAIQSLGAMIYEGVMQNLEEGTGSDTNLEYYEEWDELQTESLKEDYLRVKNLMYSILQNEFESREVREAALNAVSDLGFNEEVREWIEDFIESEYLSSQLVALHAMGKYPQYWEDQIARFLTPAAAKPLIVEAISSSYSSDSQELAHRIEHLLEMDDPDILCYALQTLANIGQDADLGRIFQEFSLHEDERVRDTAKKAIEHFTNRNFSDYMGNELGMEE